MKPSPQVSPRQQTLRRFPLTDYSFQTTAEGPGHSVAVLTEPKTPPFHKLSSDFLASETRLDYIVELFFFVLITGIAGWAIMSMLACLGWMKMVI